MAPLPFKALHEGDAPWGGGGTGPVCPPRRNAGLLHVCTGGRQSKEQKENWLVSGLEDHPPPPPSFRPGGRCHTALTV